MNQIYKILKITKILRIILQILVFIYVISIEFKEKLPLNSTNINQFLEKIFDSPNHIFF